MKITTTTAKALSRKVAKEVKEIKAQQVKEASELFLKDKRFKEYHKIQKEIKELEAKREKIVDSFEGKEFNDSTVIRSKYQRLGLYLEHKNPYTNTEEIYDDIMAKAAFVDSDVTLEDFIKDIVEDYK